MLEKDKFINAVADNVEAKLDHRLTELRSKLNQRLEDTTKDRQKEMV